MTHPTKSREKRREGKRKALFDCLFVCSFSLIRCLRWTKRITSERHWETVQCTIALIISCFSSNFVLATMSNKRVKCFYMSEDFDRLGEKDKSKECQLIDRTEKQAEPMIFSTREGKISPLFLLLRFRSEKMTKNRCPNGLIT